MKESGFLNIKTKYILKAVLFCTVFTGLFVVFSFFKSSLPEKFERISHGVIGTAIAFFTTFLFLKFDKKSFADIGLKLEKSTVKKFLIGMLIGIGIMGSLSISVIYFSGFKIELNQNSNLLNFLFLTLPLIPLAFLEELGFRGYPLSILKDKLGIRNSLLITSLLFGLYHLANGWSFQNSIMGPGVWGIIFGLAVIYSNGISMSTGLHYAVNLTTAAFGISDGSFNIWILKQKNGLSIENYESSQLATLIPQFVLLILAVIAMQWFLKKRTISKTET